MLKIWSQHVRKCNENTVIFTQWEQSPMSKSQWWKVEEENRALWVLDWVFLHSILTSKYKRAGYFIWSKGPDRPPSPMQELSRLTFTDHLKGVGQAHRYGQPFFISLKYQNQLITMCYQKLFLGPGILVSRIKKSASFLKLLQLTIFLAHCHATLIPGSLRTECILKSSRMLSYLNC